MSKVRWMGALLIGAGALWATGAQAGVVFTFSKAFGVPSVAVGSSTSLAFTINRMGGAANNITFTDNLPAGLAVSTPNGLVGDCGVGSVVTAVPGSSAVALAGGALAAGGSCTFSVQVTATAPGVKNNVTTGLNSSAGSAPAANATLNVLAASATSVPTLSEWGLMALLLAMTASAFNAVRRKKT
ncbi:putative secreted protein (IPTL-CTERM system target) [Acidovorax sp. 107]|nr:hypothetical protein ASD94_13455 [Acidovorax sp. Root70]PUA97783.1 putative secreted protein (IPTL-CTERM system target) [Acidovorax sp. 107]